MKTLPDIRALLPHQGTMVLLDRLVSVGEDTLCAEVDIHPAALFCREGETGAWVGIEYMAQAIAAYAGYSAWQRDEPVKIGFLLGTRRYECTQPAFPSGSTLQVHVQRVLQADNGLGAFECHITEKATDITVANATITVFQPESINDFLHRSPE